MLKENQTIKDVRPDLAEIEVNPPLSYVGGKIYPTLKLAAKVGDINYSALVADAAAQTGRSLGTAPTATVLGENTKAFSAAEKIKRYVVPYSSVPLYGGVAGSDKVGAMASKRSVMNAIETAQLAALITAAGTDISGGIIDGITAAAESVKRYSGKLAFVCPVGVYRWIIQQTAITGLLGRSFAGLTAEQVLSLSPEAFLAMLKGIFRFDEVLIADDDFWPAAYPTSAAVVKIADGDEFSYAMQPEYGRTAMYWPDDGPFELNSYPDDDIRGNVYDAASWLQILELNSGAKSLLQLDSSSTTTTTTTTTT